MRRFVLPVGVTSLLSVVPQAHASRELTFQDRLAAQEAIERVTYSWQAGAGRPFELAVPRELLERKVRKYLQQS